MAPVVIIQTYVKVLFKILLFRKLIVSHGMARVHSIRKI